MKPILALAASLAIAAPAVAGVLPSKISSPRPNVRRGSSATPPGARGFPEADLVTNGGFDGSINGWVTVPGSFNNPTYDSRDAANSATSGSVRLHIDSPGYTTAVMQCLPVTEIADFYYVSGDYFVTQDSPDVDRVYATLGLRYFTGASCTGTSSSGGYVEITGSGGTWQHRNPIAIGPTTAGSQSVAVQLFVAVYGGGSGSPSFETFFDNVVAQPASSNTLVSNAHFDSNLAGWTTPSAGMAEWSSLDSRDSLSSGSIYLGGSTGDIVRSDQCVQDFHFDEYELTWAYRPTSEDSNGSSIVSASFYTGSSCDGSLLFTKREAVGQWMDPEPRGGTASGWSRMRPGSFIYSTPAGANSVNVELFAHAISGPYHIYFDDIQLEARGDHSPSGTVAIEGPVSSTVGGISNFRAVGSGCSPGSLDTGWTWNIPGGQVTGASTWSTIGVKWSSAGAHLITASHPNCSATGTLEVGVDEKGPVVWTWGGAYLYQPEGTTLGEGSIYIFNAGDQASTVNFAPPASFYELEKSSVVVQPGTFEQVHAYAKNVPAGLYRDRNRLTAEGLVDLLRQDGMLVQLFVFPSSATDGVARPNATRVDLVGGSGSVRFHNTGTLPLEAGVVTTADWIVPDANEVTIPAGGDADVGFSIDRTARPDAGDPFGSVTGDLGLQYSTTASASKRATPRGSTSVTTTLVSVVDTAPPPANETGIPALGPGEQALFIPGIGHVVGSVGTFISDLSVVDRGDSDLGNVDVYFKPIPGSAGSGPQQTTISSLQSGSPLALADLVNTVFGTTAQLGTLQIRAANLDDLGVTATVFNSSNPAGTYGTAIPVVRSDRGAGPGESVWLAGVRNDASHHTNIYIQEMSGTPVTVKTDFLGPAGNVIGTRTDTVAGFALIQLGFIVPEGAVTARLSNIGSSGTFFSYATPVDELSGDTWAVSDWPQQLGYARSEPVIIPIAGALHGANSTYFQTDAAIVNTGTGHATGTLRYIDRTGPTYDQAIDLAPGETLVLEDITRTLFGVTQDSAGYMTYTPSAGETVITSRNFTTVSGGAATFGSGVPTLALGEAIRHGGYLRFGGIEDAALATIQSARPATFRTNFGLVETAGKSAKVRVTLRYEIPGTLAVARGEASTEIDVPANGFLLIGGLAKTVLGDERDEILGDMRNVQAEFRVEDGDGEIVVFTTSIDNGTGDSILRTE